MNAIFRQVVFFAIKLGWLNYRFLSGHVAPCNILITQQKQVQTDKKESRHIDFVKR